MQASTDRSGGADPFGHLERMILEKFQARSPQAASAMQLTQIYKKELERMLSQEDRSDSTQRT
jgi:hypothetical protein